MRTTSFLHAARPTGAALLGLAAGLALADAPTVQTVAVPPGHRIVVPANPYPVTYGDVSAVEGEYRLGDGRMLTVAGRTHHVFAEVDGWSRVELVPASATAFVARDARMALDFDETPNGSVSGVVMTYVPRSPTEPVAPSAQAAPPDWSAW
jgi:hypothetical protein